METVILPQSYLPELPGSAPAARINDLVRRAYLLLAATLAATALAAALGMGLAFPDPHSSTPMILALGAPFAIVFTGTNRSRFAVPLGSVFTSRMVHGGEARPIFIMVSLDLDVLNIFLSLLQIFGFLQGRRR
ncbi:HflBKC-binding inner membrane protein [mine drainage metagenome]|uniref:HflBKC-binding inner membrane protein n=1 Tax=mine drainage metagenome TaxID=410659 RepID=A0A1J5QJT2_9ZZZZ